MKKIIFLLLAGVTPLSAYFTIQANNNVWTQLHTHYEEQDWINKPSLFAQMAISFFPKADASSKTILDLGAGQGQDTRYFAEHGYNVISTDISDLALELNKSKIDLNLKDKIKVQKLDLSQDFNFQDNTFDIVYAHLSLHYFDKVTTLKIFNQIEKILKPGGIIALIVNSDQDPEYKIGQKIEEDYLKIGSVAKRYFNLKTIKYFVSQFEEILLDKLGETYKDIAKGNNNLIRFIGKKISTT